MAKPPPYMTCPPQEIQGKLERLLEPLDNHVSGVYAALNAGLSLKDNVQAYTVERAVSVASGAVSLQIAFEQRWVPKYMVVLQAAAANDPGLVITGPGPVKWRSRLNRDGTRTLQVEGVGGLDDGSYTLTLAVFPE